MYVELLRLQQILTFIQHNMISDDIINMKTLQESVFLAYAKKKKRKIKIIPQIHSSRSVVALVLVEIVIINRPDATKLYKIYFKLVARI